ncbi:phage major capsid protein [Amycolatopsis sp. cmx-8-4]|uniref:phage major capsid protein n=1 Tax=Amycolatopsis sp. cmx-8-4 TaxID=2790947 RepID=UPI00397A5055
MTIEETAIRQRVIDARMRELDRHDKLTTPQETEWQQLRTESLVLQRVLLDDAYRKGNIEDGTPSDNGHVERPGNELRGRALKAVEQSAREHGVPDTASERVTVALERDTDPDGRLARYVVEASDANYLTAFRSWMNDPTNGHRMWNDAELSAYRRVTALSRAMSLGTTTAGGFLVPYALDPQIRLSGTGSIDPMRQVSSVKLTALNEQRFVTSAGVSASWDPEAQEVSDDSPVLAQPAITAFKGQAFIPVSLELFEDSDLTTQVGNLFADAKTQLEANAFTLGTGAAQPKGVVTAVAAVGGSVVTSALTALALVDIVANQNALPPRWRTNAKFMANLSMINSARQIPLYANGPSIVNDATVPPHCFGWELLENSNIDGTIGAGASNDYVWLSGDFSQYQITDRIGTMIELIPTLFGAAGRPTGQRGFHMHWRTGGDVLIPDAFRLTNYSG